LRGLGDRGSEVSNQLLSYADRLTSILLDSPSEKAVVAGIELAVLTKSQLATERATQLAQNKTKPEGQRKAAVHALAIIDPAECVPLLGRILHDTSEPIILREQSASSLAATNKPSAQAALLKELVTAPARLEKAIAISLAGSRPGAESLLDAVRAGKASARLLQERAVEVKLRQAKIPDLDRRLASLTKGLPSADQRLQELLNQRRSFFSKTKPDVALGAKMFDKHCAACHQIANKGNKLGPHLDGIGLRGVERLLEDILDPHRNVDQAFRTTTLTLANGQSVSGLFLREDGTVLIIADAQGKEVRVAKNTVDQRTITPLSPMPANFAEAMSDVELVHLLAFLLERRAP
jgi:putative heme-binding domain-containing protein